MLKNYFNSKRIYSSNIRRESKQHEQMIPVQNLLMHTEQTCNINNTVCLVAIPVIFLLSFSVFSKFETLECIFKSKVIIINSISELF